MTRNSVRLFFALWPDKAVRQAIESIRARLEVRARAVPPQNLHMTVMFLGQVALDRLGELEDLAKRVRLPAEPLVLDRLGWFQRTRVGWLGSGSVPAAWNEAVTTLGERLRHAGFRSARRRWNPHVTLYRDLRTPLAKIAFEAITWEPEFLCLAQSETGEKGPDYRIVGRWG